MRVIDEIRGQGSCQGYNQGQLEEVLSRHSRVLSEEPGLTNLAMLTIKTGEAEPIAQYPYRPADRLLGKIKEEVDSLRDRGIIQPSESLWASPVIPVPKPNGSICVCVSILGS